MLHQLQREWRQILNMNLVGHANLVKLRHELRVARDWHDPGAEFGTKLDLLDRPN